GVRLLMLFVLGVAVLTLGSGTSLAQSTFVTLTDVPGKWFDPSVTVAPVGGTVEFRTTSFSGTFTSAIFPCTPSSITDGTCGVGNKASFPAGFAFDQADPLPLGGSVTVTFPVPGIYVFADKVHLYA